MARKNRSLARKAEIATRQRRAYVDDLVFKDVAHGRSGVVMVKAEHVGWRGTVRRTTIDTTRRSIVATHW